MVAVHIYSRKKEQRHKRLKISFLLPSQIFHYLINVRTAAPPRLLPLRPARWCIARLVLHRSTETGPRSVGRQPAGRARPSIDRPSPGWSVAAAARRVVLASNWNLTHVKARDRRANHVANEVDHTAQSSL